MRPSSAPRPARTSSHDTVANETGNYTFPNLPDGIYNVKAELQGFKTVVREDVRVAVNTTVRVDLALQVGGLEETVTVTGETPLLQTDRTDTGRVLESVQVSVDAAGVQPQLPGDDGHDPRCRRPYRAHSEFFNSQDSLSSEVNGQSRLANNVQIEGLDNNQRTGLLTVLIPPAEAIDTVSVTTSNYDAEFGRAAGAVTSVTLKSGTNKLKGSAFWFGNTEATNSLPASTYFSPVADEAATTASTSSGSRSADRSRRTSCSSSATTSGPSDASATSYRFVVPTEAFRHGDFSAAPTKVYDPTTGDAGGAGRTQFAGNLIPANRISPIALQPSREDPAAEHRGRGARPDNYQIDATATRTRTGSTRRSTTR